MTDLNLAYNASEDLRGQFAIVTGAAQGLGKAIASAYARAGLRLALMDVKADALAQVCNDLRAETNADCLPIAVDLSQIEPTQAAIAQALAHGGRPRVLVHNAAILNEHPLLDLTMQEWLLTVNVGIQAAFILTQACWQPMTDAGKGSVVYVSSRSGIQGFRHEAHYCAAKHGLEGMMKCLADEGQARNIAVNTVTPGMYMHTPMSEQNYPEDLKQQWVDPILLTPAFVRLAQQDAGGITGQRLSAWELSEHIRSEHASKGGY